MESPLIHHQGVICFVAFGRFSLRRIVYTPHSALLGALHLTPCWCPGFLKILNYHCPLSNLIVDFGREIFLQDRDLLVYPSYQATKVLSVLRSRLLRRTDRS